jgi:hypothetical protein
MGLHNGSFLSDIWLAVNFLNEQIFRSTNYPPFNHHCFAALKQLFQNLRVLIHDKHFPAGFGRRAQQYSFLMISLIGFDKPRLLVLVIFYHKSFHEKYGVNSVF